MKKLFPVFALLASATNAFAASGRQDDSGILVWAFLGFCALIVVAQVVPSLLLLFGIAKGIAGKPQLAHQTRGTGPK